MKLQIGTRGAAQQRRRRFPFQQPPAIMMLTMLLALTLALLAMTGCFAGGMFGGGDLPPVAYIVSDGDTGRDTGDDGGGGDGGGDSDDDDDDNDAVARVWMAAPGGDGPAPVSDEGGAARYPRWAPGHHTLVWNEAGEPARLMAYDAASREVTELVSGIDARQPPVWAPDGTRIAYRSASADEPDLYMVNLADGVTTRLTFNPAQEVIGDWSPDGQWIIFTEAGSDGLLLRNPDGVNRIALTDGADSGPVWSPKGDRIAFLRRTEDGHDIYILRPTESDDWTEDTDEVAVAQSDEDEFAPAWSSDGRRLAYVARVKEQTEIFTVRVDGSEREQLTQNTADDLMPAWSQNGDHIAFVSYAYGNAEILYMKGDGSEQMRLTRSDGADTHPDW